ncbi:MAG TPA: ABC transporter ATP-binding protein [Chloroflexota bacterium]|nr:ABC transporter ATP-binding protein [Chloroflexota bacterium]
MSASLSTVRPPPAPRAVQGQPLPTRRLLATYLAPQWRRVVMLGASLAATLGLRLASPQLLRAFIDEATAGAPVSTLVQIALVFLGAALALQATALAEVYVAENVGLTATNWLRADLARHILRLDPPFHAAHTPGELIERTDGDVATLGNFFSRFVVYLVGNALLLVGILALLAQIDPRIGAAAAAFALIGVAVMLGLRRLAVPRFAALRQANADLFGLIEERLAGTEDVRANGGVGYVLHRLLERSRHLLWADVKARLTGSATFQSAFLCLEVATAATLALGVWLYGNQALSIGTVYLIFAYTQSLHQPLNAIMRQLEQLQQAVASIGRVRELLAERSAIVDGPGPPPPAGALAVELDHVTFAYEPAVPVLRDVSLRLAPGQVLGVLGRTGSGKTTLARLLFRLYDPQRGSIRLGGVDARQPAVQALRARIGVVTQDVQLFHASVRDNVTFFDPTVPDERVVAVLEELDLGSWLRGLPDGLATRLAPGGGSLSAGEAQLLAFARVFLKDPGLVILDEPSSRLDPATERRLERAVDGLLGGGRPFAGAPRAARTRTAIVIAHRLATVERADRILILEDGRVAEEGERAALAADPGSRFSRLLRAGMEEVLV